MLDLFDGLPERLRPYFIAAAAGLAGATAGLLLISAGIQLVTRLSARRTGTLARSVRRNLATPLRAFGIVLGALLALLGLESGDAAPYRYAERVCEVALYGVGAWLVISAVGVIGDLVLAQYSYSDSANNYRERKVYTQVLYIKRVITFVAIVLAFALVLFQFESVRELGAGLLASAGVAGIVIGVAAQKSLANLLAGFQIAFTQPLRIDDQVIIAGEYGRVEEITLTYVVIRVWDDRRLIVPLNKVIEETFQNWSRHSTELLGTVMLYLDYGVDLDGLRGELGRILTGEATWDQRVSVVQVTDTSESAMTVRVLVSARTPGDAFDLRCRVREGLLTYLRSAYAYAFPTRRELVRAAAEDDRPTTAKGVNPPAG